MTYTAEEVAAAKARVPFAWGISSSPGGLVHDWERCEECRRLRRWSIGIIDPVQSEGAR